MTEEYENCPVYHKCFNVNKNPQNCGEAKLVRETVEDMTWVVENWCFRLKDIGLA